MRAIRNGLQGAGIPVENSKGEWGPGQEEINVRYADALTMADRHVILKNGVQGDRAARRARRSPSWRSGAYDLAGSSSHIHKSLWDAAGKKPLFHDQKGEHGMSTLMRHYVAGQLTYAREITWFLAPYINSYKRFQVGTFAPTKAIWSLRQSHRRLPALRRGHARRSASNAASAAPTSTPTSPSPRCSPPALPASRRSWSSKPPSSATPTTASSLREMPKTLREATETMAKSKMLRAAFGDEVIDHYVHTAEWEQFEYDRRITDWELKRGFERY